MKFITPSIVVNLMGSAVCEVQEQALSLLRNIAFGIPKCSKSKIVLEEALESLTSLMDSFNESTGGDLLYIGSKTLALACQVYLDFSPDELESVLQALMKLLKYESSHVLSYACSGIMYLCDGKQKMVVEEQQLGTLVDRLIELIDSESRVKTIGGLTALGSIVRWGSDSNIEVIIEKDTLLSLECLLGEDDKYYVSLEYYTFIICKKYIDPTKLSKIQVLGKKYQNKLLEIIDKREDIADHMKWSKRLSSDRQFPFN